MVGESSAQAWAAMLILAGYLPDTDFTPVRLVYDNEIASKFAQAVAHSEKNLLLHTTLSTCLQVTTMRRAVSWSHTDSHRGDRFNNLDDAVVAAASYNEKKTHGSQLSTCQHRQGIPNRGCGVTLLVTGA